MAFFFGDGDDTAVEMKRFGVSKDIFSLLWIQTSRQKVVNLNLWSSIVVLPLPLAWLGLVGILLH